MPKAAIATQMVDVVASPADIASKVTQISKHPYLTRSPEPDPGPAIEEDQLRRIFRLLLPACGVNFSHYKTPTIIRRLFRRMALLRIIEPEAYITYLERTPGEVVNLHNDLLIHVTKFFREPESFEFIAREVLPTHDLASAAPLRMWVAGCATGEEVYSLAMIVHEAFDGRLESAHVQIFGTDVSESAVAFARQGLYPASIADDVSARASPGFLHEDRRRLSGQQGAARHVRLRPSGSDARPAVLASRPDMLSQCADIHGRAASTKAAVHVSLRAEAGGGSGARPRRKHRVSLGPVHVDEQEEQGVSQESAGQPSRRTSTCSARR